MTTVAELSVGDSVRTRAKGQAHYWAVQGDRVLVAPTLRDLVAALDHPHLSPMGLSALARRRGGIWLTPFEGVHRLTFGHELVVTGDGPQVRRWLRPEETPRTQRPPADVMREAIEAAVLDCVGNDDAALVTVSGGLDSTTVAAVAAHLMPNATRLRGFCAVPMVGPPTPHPQRRWDEWPLASAVGAHTGLPVERWQNSGDEHWLELADELHERHLYPVPAWGNVWWMRRAEREAATAGVRVVLTGQSGNATYSIGPAGLPPPLRGIVGARRSPRGWWRDRRRPGGPSPQRTDVPIVLPPHWHAMDRWTRWCLAEPPLASNGPWTGSAVRWCDPLGSETVVRAAMSLPPSAWTDEGGRRALARAVGRGLLPSEVVDSTQLGMQGSDLAHLVRERADHYATAIERVCASRSAALFLDLGVLSSGTSLLQGSEVHAQEWVDRHLGALATGLFAAWWDERG